MKDIEYGLFAQIAYYNWHNYVSNEKRLLEIFERDLYMNNLLKGKSEEFQEQNKEKEVEFRNGATAKIYNQEDKRLLMMYSEELNRPDINQKYKSIFDGWEFVEGINHEKIYYESEKILIDKEVIVDTKPMEGYGAAKVIRGKGQVEFNTAGIDKGDSGFQGVAFKKGTKVIINNGNGFEMINR